MRTNQSFDRPPRYSRPVLRILTPFIGVFGQACMFPMLLGFKSGSLRPLFVYVIVDLLVVGAAIALLLRFIQRLRAKLRAADGAICPDCGYDLRGLNESGDCPECGLAFERAAVVARWRRHMPF